MNYSTQKLRWTVLLLFVVFASSLLPLSVQAQDAVQIAHRVVRQRILRDASDRRDVRFLTTSTGRMMSGWRSVTGRGSFRRQGKSTQRFTYRATVNPRTRATRNVDYDIR